MDLITLEYSEMIDGKLEKNSLQFSKYLLKKPYREESLFVTKIDGHSMQPLIKDKSLVVADLTQLDIQSDRIYLLKHDNKMWIKQAKVHEGETKFVSINNEYAHLVYPLDEVRVIARAVLTFTNL